MAGCNKSVLVTVTVAVSMMMICCCHVSEGAANDLISKVCSEAKNPSVCERVLRPVQPSKGADLAGLASTALEHGIDIVEQSLAAITLIRGDCTDFYTDAIDSLYYCRENLVSRDWDNLYNNAVDALDSIATCDDILTAEPGDVEPPAIAQADLTAEEAVYVVIAVAKYGRITKFI
ncbi:hypothetical protein ACP275_14G276200 [Erythranthe tilingii]